MAALNSLKSVMPVFNTVTVTVLRPVTELDEFNEEVATDWETDDVDCVLVSPGRTIDLGVDRPNGIQCDLVFHFPYWYESSLRGCLIEYEGERFSVIGDPQPYMAENTPGEWNRQVATVMHDG